MYVLLSTTWVSLLDIFFPPNTDILDTPPVIYLLFLEPWLSMFQWTGRSLHGYASCYLLATPCNAGTFNRTGITIFCCLLRFILRTYAHDDISVGSWFIGLDVKHVNERKFCCSSQSAGWFISIFPWHAKNKTRGTKISPKKKRANWKRLSH